MKYFTLVLALCLCNLLSAQTAWSDGLIAKFDFSANSVSHSQNTIWEDIANGDTQLSVFGDYYDDEEGPDGSNSAIGIDNENAASHLRVIPGSHPVWTTTQAFSLSFGYMEFAANTGTNPIAALIDNSGQWLLVTKQNDKVILRYAASFTAEPIESEANFPALNTNSFFPWYAMNVVLDGATDEIRLYIDGLSILEFSVPMDSWNDLQVYMAHDAQETSTTNWLCYSDVYLHDRAFQTNDAATYYGVVYNLVDEQSPILDDSPIAVFPNVLSRQTEMRIVNPAGTTFSGQVLDGNGRVIQQFNHQASVLNLQDVSNGVYYLRFVTEEGMVMRSVVVQ